MKQEQVDWLADTEDVLTDCIREAVEIDAHDDMYIDHEEFIKEFQSRTKRVQIKALYDLMGPKSRTEFEEMMSELYKHGAK